jgi:hypothetical protein
MQWHLEWLIATVGRKFRPKMKKGRERSRLRFNQPGPFFSKPTLPVGCDVYTWFKHLEKQRG